MLCVVLLLLSATHTPASPTEDDIFETEQVNMSCRNGEWECQDGYCILNIYKCNGAKECPDGSDESFAYCWDNKCKDDQFRCTYGACVNGTAPCNGFPACVDNSDELLPICRNDQRVMGGKFECFDGTTIPSVYRCDGITDCGDGSDEVLWTCAAEVCPLHWFQCAYGACVEEEAACNQVKDCADDSDEDVDLCNEYLKEKAQPITTYSGSQIHKCVLPPYPTHGTYSTLNDARPGEGLDVVNINVTCHQGYQVNGSSSIYCYNGWWSEEFPQCLSQCHLTPHPSVDYHCADPDSMSGSRPCNEYELEGTVVTPTCRSPEYYSPNGLPKMQCINGSWTHTALCLRECGTVGAHGDIYSVLAIIGGKMAILGEAPWHAGIYTKTKMPYKQICGGSLISKNIIISAAHCFWNNEEGRQNPVTNYAAAVGKIYRPWGIKNEEYCQKSDVKEIHLPVRFQGSAANYQDDIAVVVVARQFTFTPVIRPVCINFTFDREQLEMNKPFGKVAGWGLTNKSSMSGSPKLSVLWMPYVNTETCINESPPSFRPFITSDKFCAGYKGSNKAVCQGDSGGGLAFPKAHGWRHRFYLHGIVSTAPDPDNEDTCNDDTYTAFTDLQSHERFIKQFWNPYQ